MVTSTQLKRSVGAFSILALLFLSFSMDVTLSFAASPIIVNTIEDTENMDRQCSLREAVQAARAGADRG